MFDAIPRQLLFIARGDCNFFDDSAFVPHGSIGWVDANNEIDRPQLSLAGTNSDVRWAMTKVVVVRVKDAEPVFPVEPN